MSKSKKYHKSCHDCGQFICKRLWVELDHSWKDHALCEKCLSNYEDLEAPN